MTLPRVETWDEDEVVARARLGDRDAFGLLVAAHQHKVFTLALRLVGDRDLAADVAQEAFVRAWRGLPRFRADALFGTWMHRITVNAAWTMRRRAQRAATVPLEQAATVVDGGLTPEHAAANAELRGELGAALRSLRPAERAVVVLKDVHGWTHAEVADALGISVAAAKVRLHRARKRLRTMLKGSGA